MSSRNPLVTLRASNRSRVGVKSLALWRVANFDLARPTSSALCASDRSCCGQVLILILARDSRNHLGAFCAPALFLFDAVLILRSLVQPSRHFGRVRSHLLRHSVHARSLRATISALVRVRLLSPRRSAESVKGFCTQILTRRSSRDLVQRSCKQVSCGDLAK